MTTVPTDVREVILATIRQRLLDDDLHTLRLGRALDQHCESIAEHALDAASARGASLSDIGAAAVAAQVSVRVEGMDFDPPPLRVFDPPLNEFPDDVPVEQLFGDDVPLAIRGMTLYELRRGLTLSALTMLVQKLSMRAFGRVFGVFEARLWESDLDPEDAQLGQLVGHDEQIALFTAGLYGDEATSSR